MASPGRPRKLESIKGFDADSVFDIEKIDDLPSECRKEVAKVQRFNEKISMMIRLFGMKSPLTTPEIVAGMYRVNKVVVTRQWVSTSCSNLVTRGLLQNPKKGVFKNILASEIPEKYKDAIEEIRESR